MYLKRMKLLSEQEEYGLILGQKQIHNSNYYPTHIFPEKEFSNIEFDNITIFYGGNGSGKTTLLNIIGQKLNASKKSINERGEVFDGYVDFIYDYEIDEKDLYEIKLISSDDVFDYLLDVRAINSNINRRKTELSKQWYDMKYGNNVDCALEDYEMLKNKVDANKMSASKYIRSRLTNNNILQQSNGESALEFWEKEIRENALYLLDEPENSLSAENQVKLAKFIEESARFYNCQFIISTHSPFLLSLKDSKVYDLDEVPVKEKNWTDLKNVRVYYDFFNKHKEKFDKQ